jgi:hypothetical protein
MNELAAARAGSNARASPTEQKHLQSLKVFISTLLGDDVVAKVAAILFPWGSV